VRKIYFGGTVTELANGDFSNFIPFRGK